MITFRSIYSLDSRTRSIQSCVSMANSEFCFLFHSFLLRSFHVVPFHSMSSILMPTTGLLLWAWEEGKRRRDMVYNELKSGGKKKLTTFLFPFITVSPFHLTPSLPLFFFFLFFHCFWFKSSHSLVLLSFLIILTPWFILLDLYSPSFQPKRLSFSTLTVSLSFLSLPAFSIMDKGVNNCGRGINVAVIDSSSKSIISVSNYDTYQKDSSSLESLLMQIHEGDIVLLLTFDEPSSKLSQVARTLFHELGSGKAQNLNYRTSWYLITQKGISGYSPYEEIHLPSYNASQAARSVWGSPHDIRMCLPLHCESKT